MSYSFKSIVDGGADTDLIYYNAQLIAAQTADLQSVSVASPIRFNETRDSAIVKDASQYYFSIVRFSMNGPGKNLPLFIPLIQTNGYSSPIQSDPNLTIYYVSLAYQREWNYTDVNGVAQTYMMTITPSSNPIRYIPETQNTAIAPVPSVPAGGITKQDISSRYYWVYSYKHWTELVNNALKSAMKDIWTSFNLTWAAIPGKDPAQTTPYPTYDSFLLAHDEPYVRYDEVTGLFEIYGDTRAFNVSGQIREVGTFGPYENGTQAAVPAFVPAAYAPADPPSPASDVYIRLFFNDNLFGLMNNFNNTYLGANYSSSIMFPLTPTPVRLFDPVGSSIVPIVYTTEILFTNQQYQNILNNNPTLQNNPAAPPPSYNPCFLIPTQKQNLYWKAIQDYPSTGSLWSPVAAIVFTSVLLPLKKEYSAVPISLGTTNTQGTTNSPSSFDPIISDFVLDENNAKAQGWRDFVLYEPSAEYRLVSMNASHEEIRNIDIQVFWRYRLTGELVPLSMFNCSDVSIKMMFRKIDYRS